MSRHRKEIENVIDRLTVSPGSEDGLNEISPGLWLGNESCLEEKTLAAHGIRTLLNVSDSILPTPPSVASYKFPMVDRWACQANAMDLIERCAYLVHLRMRSGPVLIYCKRGHHRSACVVMHYLVKYESRSPSEAVRLIKEQRPTALRRFSCMLENLIQHYEAGDR